MAPTTVAAGCCPMLPQTSQSLEPPPEVGSGRRRLSLDSWVCLPILRPVRTTTTTTSSTTTSSSQVSSSGSSCTTTQKDAKDLPSVAKTLLTLETVAGTIAGTVADDDALSRVGVVGDTGCETPKSKEHRIPDVDVTFCPPAPRKPRAISRRRRVQPTSFFNTPDFENFLSQHKVQVSS